MASPVCQRTAGQCRYVYSIVGVPRISGDIQSVRHERIGADGRRGTVTVNTVDGVSAAVVMSVPQRFGAILRHARLLAGLSQEGLAEHAGLSADAVSALESGRRRQPRASTVAALAAALNLSVEERAALIAAARGLPAPAPVSAAVPAGPALVGRDGELAELAAVLDPGGPHRLVTLVGPGGVGKTVLARAVVAMLAERYPGGAVIVDLSGETDHGYAVDAIARAGRVRLDARDPVGSLVAGLTPRRSLLVIDCVDRVREGLRPVLQRLLVAAGPLVLLATGRVPLLVPGEYRFPVTPLPSPELPPADGLAGPGVPAMRLVAANPSVQLLVERVRRHATQFSLTPQNATAVATVCARLEGLPLALELAAARVPVLGLPGLLTRTGRRIDLLDGGPAELPERHRSLRATLSWSVDLLTEEQRYVFAVGGVFTGGTTMDALNSVCTAEREVAGGVPAAVSGLVEAGMLTEAPGRPPRYTMLETVREYALELLDAGGQRVAVEQRFAGYFLAVVEGALALLRAGEQATALGAVAAEEANLRAATDWAFTSAPLLAVRLCTEMWPFWYVGGQLSEGRRQLDRALDQWPAPDAHRADLLRGAAVLATQQGDLAQAAGYAEACLTLQRRIGGPKALTDALTTAGNVTREQGRYEVAYGLYQECLALCRQLQDPVRVSVSLNNLGTLARVRRQLDEATAMHTESLALRRRIGDTVGVAYCLEQLAQDARVTGDLEAALAYARESLALSQSLSARPGAARAHALLALVCRRRGAYREAVEQASQALAAGIVLEDQGMIATALGHLAGVAADRRDPRLAARLLGAAAEAARRGGATLDPEDAAAQAEDERTVRAGLPAAEVDAALQEGAAIVPADFLDLPPA